MARPTTSTEKRTERIIPVTFATVAQKKEAQAYARRKGQTLAGLLKLLLAADMAATPPSPAAPAAPATS